MKKYRIATGAAMLALALVACGPAEPGGEAGAGGATTSPDAGGSDPSSSPISPEAVPVPDDALRVVFETSAGDIVIGLYADRAPATVENFLAYIDAGFYDGTVFHRVVPEFMVQGGAFTADLQQKPTRDPIVNESGNGLSNVRGTVAMARRNDPDSATSQFFINLVDRNRYLDTAGGGYTVFGLVLEGMEVVDRMATAQTMMSPILPSERSLPTEPVEVRSARRAQ